MSTFNEEYSRLGLFNLLKKMYEQINSINASGGLSIDFDPSAEQERAAAEIKRNSSENDRTCSENKRSVAEAERIINENIRCANETDRVNAELARKEAAAIYSNRYEEQMEDLEELKRKVLAGDISIEFDPEVEARRQVDELIRKSNEDSRKINEIKRESNEAFRIKNEQGRLAAESIRRQNESARQNAEQERQTIYTKAAETFANEEQRILNEKNRVFNENERKISEYNRNSEYTALSEAMQILIDKGGGTNSGGLGAPMTQAEYNKLKKAGALKYMIYSVYKNGELSRLYFGNTLIGKKAEEGEQISVGLPLVFPFVFG